MIENFYNDRCDIYHIREEKASPGFSLPTSPTHEYPDEPDVSDIPCHFCVKSSVSVIQQKPMAVMDARIKLILPAGTDIRLNDKIVNRDNGLEYTAELPQDIHGHHMYVYATKIERQKAIR